MTPRAIQESIDAGRAHHQAGRLVEAAAIYDRLLAVHPAHAELLYLRGAVARQRGHADEAIALMRRAVAADPGIGAYHVGLGVALAQAGCDQESVTALRHAVNLNSHDAEAHSNLSLALLRTGSRAEAISAARRAVEISPDRPEFWGNLGLAQKEDHQYDQAVTAFERALSIRVDLASVWTNLGSALMARGDQAGAVAAFRRAISLQPNLPMAHLNLASWLLLHGEFDQGWNEYEWRWRVPQSHEPPRAFPQNAWQGEELADRRILLHGEQGFGDVIQFVRYVPSVAARGGRVLLECYGELTRLIEQQKFPGVEAVISRGSDLPVFDLHCPLMSLPRVFGTNLQTIPDRTPYLSVDPAEAEKWKSRLAGGVGPTVGLVWAGKSRPDPLRTIGFANMTPLLDVAGVRFVSLQKGEGSEQAAAAAGRIADWTADLRDFADTAALISCLDLVITIDTAVAHLAAALGKATWVLLPFAPTWRWMLDRPDSPWYPTMRLFRQPTFGDWQSPVRAAASALAQLVRRV